MMSDAIAFLHQSYKPHAFAWTLVDISRQLLLTGVFALILPGSATQIVIGTITAVCFAVLQSYASPYRAASNNVVATSAAYALVLTFQGSLVVGHVATADMTLVLFVLIGASLVVLGLLLVCFSSSVAAELRLPLLRWESDGTCVEAPPLRAGETHCFISHPWASAQDQARSLKSLTTALVPGLKVFLECVAAHCLRFDCMF